ncbi:hypothetical protein CHUAL_010500 [Chamberlinius hualienensis]
MWIAVKGEDWIKYKDMDDEPSSNRNKMVDHKSNGNNNNNVDVDVEAESETDWTIEEICTLIDRIQRILPQNDNTKFSTKLKRIDWETLKFGHRSAIDCKIKWMEIMETALRKYRTMTELVNDAKVWVKQPWTSYRNPNCKHPDLPKKPLVSYFRFYMKKSPKYIQKHPLMAMTQVSKELSRKFAKLSRRKKQKYTDSWQREYAIYIKEMEKFKEEHPDIDSDGNLKIDPVIIIIPSKPKKASQLFLDEMMSKHINLDFSDEMAYKDKYKEKWKNLNDNKRSQWIRKAILKEQNYTTAVEQKQRLNNPKFKFGIR